MQLATNNERRRKNESLTFEHKANPIKCKLAYSQSVSTKRPFNQSARIFTQAKSQKTQIAPFSRNLSNCLALKKMKQIQRGKWMRKDAILNALEMKEWPIGEFFFIDFSLSLAFPIRFVCI